MILLVGSHGKIGTRYRVVLKNLGLEYICSDTKMTQFQYSDDFIIKNVTGIVLCTPTHTHIDMIYDYSEYRKPILCEKPISRNLSDLKNLFKEIRTLPFQMVYQYGYAYEIAKLRTTSYQRRGMPQMTWYDYFDHGQDGLVWDCIQIVGLHKDTEALKLGETSDLWECGIHGVELSLEDIYLGYRQMFIQWAQKPSGDKDKILAIHEKCHELNEKFYGRKEIHIAPNSDSDPKPIDEYAVTQ